MIVQIRRSTTVNMDGRWWVGVKRWPSKWMAQEWKNPRAWIIGLGPLQVRIWPGIFKQQDNDKGVSP